MVSFLIDENVEFSLVTYLREKGYDVLSIAERYPSLDDASILMMAVKEKRIVVTSDKDFGNLVFREKLPSSGVILFRMDNQSSQRKVEVVNILLENYHNKLAGNFVTISDAKIKIRKIESGV